MNRHARGSQTILMAALGVLAPLAADGCNSTVDGPGERRSLTGDALEVEALGLASVGSTASRPKNIGWGLAAEKARSDTASAMLATYAGDPAVGVAHGSLLLPDGSTGPATPLFARVAQHYYVERLLGEASPAVREEFQTRSQPVEGDPREFADNALLIAWLIEQVQPTDASDLKSINKFIAKATSGDLPAELGLVAGDPSSRESYKETCRNALVPIPPDWNPDANEWKKKSTPPTPIFIGEESTTATVWYYESTDPVGTCIALPRADSNGVITSLGVICQGYDKSKACFWDNTRDIQPNAKVAILSDGFNAGPDLDGGIGGKCTDCHRGENAYIIHPGSSLNLAEDPGLPMFAESWVTPIVHDEWFQNPEPEGLHGLLECVALESGENGCSKGGCHMTGKIGRRLPQLGGEHSKYCDFVIMPAILPGDKKTMPHQAESLRFRSDQEAIAKACGWDVSALEFPPRASETEPLSLDPDLCPDAASESNPERPISSI